VTRQAVAKTVHEIELGKQVGMQRLDALHRAVNELDSNTSVMITRSNTEVDVRPLLESLKDLSGNTPILLNQFLYAVEIYVQLLSKQIEQEKASKAAATLLKG
jgi:protein tyrosine/serine phosphatase